MFHVSFTEMMLIGVVALIVIGPERLPKVARTVGHLLGRAQRYVNDVKSDIKREVELDELRKFKSEMDEAAHNVKTSLRETETSMRTELDEVTRETNQSIADLQRDVASPATPAASSSSTSASPVISDETLATPVELATPSQPKTPTTL